MDSTVDFRAIVWAMGDAVIGAGRDGAIRLWNPAAERMFGFTTDEALGRSLDLIIPERFRNRHWERYHQVMRTGQTKYGTEVLRVPAPTSPGRGARPARAGPSGDEARPAPTDQSGGPPFGPEAV